MAEVNGLNTTNATNNASGVSFAGGYTDWRLPTIVELQTILVAPFDCGPFPNCVDPIFNTNCAAGCTNTALDPANACSCTASSSYWSSTSGADFPDGAWDVDFNFGFVGDTGKSFTRRVRAVRGGR